MWCDQKIHFVARTISGGKQEDQDQNISDISVVVFLSRNHKWIWFLCVINTMCNKIYQWLANIIYVRIKMMIPSKGKLAKPFYIMFRLIVSSQCLDAHIFIFYLWFRPTRSLQLLWLRDRVIFIFPYAHTEIGCNSRNLTGCLPF